MNPNRTSKNVSGDFYTTGFWHEGEESGDCLDCAIPEAEAPTLLADINKDDNYTHFIRQPETEEEIEQACQACEICCVNALRYAGSNLSIIKRLGNNPEYCDFVYHEGEIVLSLDSSGDTLPFAEIYREAYYRKLKIDYSNKFRFINIRKYKVNKLSQWIKKIFVVFKR
ncbi:MAG: ferredoxin [Saccharospirillaceae bacterium]|nr:hypothetical protein [Pseudomonadales bacterium]NRB80702.1 ferredoxin [Saccharospirillaceae bacterium]